MIQIRQHLAYDPFTGAPYSTRRVVPRRLVSRTENGELIVSDGSRMRRWARMVWEHFHGPMPDGYDVTYRNGDKDDCTIDNLAAMPRAERCRRGARRLYVGASGYPGVHGTGRTRKPWQAVIQTEGKSRCLGSFAEPEDAYRVYYEAKRALHGVAAVALLPRPPEPEV